MRSSTASCASAASCARRAYRRHSIWARFLADSELPSGDETVIITNGGGIGVLATDACEKYGVTLYDDPQESEGEVLLGHPCLRVDQEPRRPDGAGDREGLQPGAPSRSSE